MAWPLVLAVIKGTGTVLDVGGNTVGAYVDVAERENNERAKAAGRKNVVSDGLDEVLKFCDDTGTVICQARDDAGATIRSAAGDNEALCTVVDGLGTVVDCTMGFGKELVTDIAEGAKHASDAIGVKLGYGYDTLEDEGIGWAQPKSQRELEDMSFGERARTYGLFGTMLEMARTADGRDAASRLVFGHGIEAEEKAQLGGMAEDESAIREHVIADWANDRTRWQRSLYMAYTNGEVTKGQLVLIERMVANPNLGMSDEILADTAQTLQENGTTWGAFADAMDERLTQTWHDDMLEQYEQGGIDATDANDIIDAYNQGTTDSVELAAVATDRKRSNITWHQAMRQAAAIDRSRTQTARGKTPQASDEQPSEEFMQGLIDADQYVEERVQRIQDDYDNLKDEPKPSAAVNKMTSRSELGLS